MQRHRALLAFGIAWVSAVVLSWWVYRTRTAPQTGDLVRIVAAAQDLPAGKRVLASDLKLITVGRKDVPKGSFQKTADVIDRAIAVAISANEPVLNAKLAGKGSGEGLTALIEPGTRAVSVQVNEISGVAGFIQPGTRVDVLFTRVFSNGDAATTTILQNVKVLAYGRQLEPATRADSTRDAARADTNPNALRPNVATLLVTQAQAERLVLAAQRGRIQLVLRNTLDDHINEFADPVQSTDLGIDEPRRPEPVARVNVRPAPPAGPPPSAPAKTAKSAADENDGEDNVVRVRIYRGEKVTEDTFK